MTREDKIRNIIQATAEAIKIEEENGTMTVEKYAYIIENRDAAILAIA